MSPIPVSKTKIIPPSRRPQLLTRKRLLEFMYEALDDKKITLLSAQAGYGKTSLLIDFIHQNNDLKSCWLALDELDRDPQRFATYFIASIKQQFPDVGKQSNDVLERMSLFDQDMERLLVTFINEIIENTNEFFVIMLDDFHLVEDVEVIKKFINRFVQLMPENCHLIISSRKLTDLPELALLVSRGQASGLDFAELQFKTEELQALIAQNEDRHISDDEAERLIGETDGWVTGLQFSNNKLPNAGDQAILFNYFKQQVLDRQPPELRTFILRTALLDEFDKELCEKVLAPLYDQKPDWQNLIAMIASNNVFALPVGENQSSLRYHHLFREFIREQFQNELPDEVNPILSNLQLAYESANEWEKAHAICRKLNNATALAEFIERAGSFMLQRANMILDSWLNELPVSMLKERPRLLSIRGAIMYLKGDFQESLKLLNQAEGFLRHEEDATELALVVSRRANTYRLLGDYEKSLVDIEEFLQITQEDVELLSLYAEALRSKGLLLFRLGEANKSIELFEKSLQLYEFLDEKRNIPVVLMESGMAYRTVADFDKAQKTYEKALEIWRQEGDLLQQAILLNNLGVFYQFLGQYEQSVLAFEEGLLCAKNIRYLRGDALISIGLGDVYAELEDFDMARQNYEHAHEIIKMMDDSFLRNALIFSQAQLAFLQKNTMLAHELMDSIKATILARNSNSEIGLLHLIEGRLALLEKKYPKALEELKNSEKHFADGGRSMEADIARVWLAAALHQNKKTNEAIELINSLTRIHGNLFHPVFVAGYQARDWLSHLQAKSTPSKLVRDLASGAEKLVKEIASIRRQVKRQASVVPASAPTLKIQAFGNAMAYMDNKPCAWQTQAVRELFFYFLNMHKPLTKEQVGELLWPDKYESSQLSLRFKNEVYRLRKVVGQKTILFENDLYRFNHDIDYEYDVEAFEAFISKAKSAQSAKQKIDSFQKAIDLVEGPYLNDIYSDWAIEERGRLEKAYEKALYELADLYYKDGQLEKATNICEKVIEIDPIEEKAYKIAMNAYHRLNDRASIVRIYQRYIEVIKSKYDLEPSNEMEELYRKLTK